MLQLGTNYSVKCSTVDKTPRWNAMHQINLSNTLFSGICLTIKFNKHLSPDLYFFIDKIPSYAKWIRRYLKFSLKVKIKSIKKKTLFLFTRMKFAFFPNIIPSFFCERSSFFTNIFRSFLNEIIDSVPSIFWTFSMTSS